MGPPREERAEGTTHHYLPNVGKRQQPKSAGCPLTPAVHKMPIRYEVHQQRSPQGAPPSLWNQPQSQFVRWQAWTQPQMTRKPVNRLVSMSSKCRANGPDSNWGFSRPTGRPECGRAASYPFAVFGAKCPELYPFSVSEFFKGFILLSLPSVLLSAQDRQQTRLPYLVASLLHSLVALSF